MQTYRETFAIGDLVELRDGNILRVKEIVAPHILLTNITGQIIATGRLVSVPRTEVLGGIIGRPITR